MNAWRAEDGRIMRARRRHTNAEQEDPRNHRSPRQSASLAVVAVAPAVSQAQWHTIVVGGQVITHSNFTEGGVSPCTRISGQLGSARNLVNDDHEWLQLKGISTAGTENATKELESNEAAVRRAEQEAFEYGCDIAPA